MSLKSMLMVALTTNVLTIGLAANAGESVVLELNSGQSYSLAEGVIGGGHKVLEVQDLATGTSSMKLGVSCQAVVGSNVRTSTFVFTVNPNGGCLVSYKRDEGAEVRYIADAVHELSYCAQTHGVPTVQKLQNAGFVCKGTQSHIFKK